ncbi:MAG: RNA 2',3'-cyclic phosphodiesterase [Micrococcales bacterium]|nr:RNA 2',3'-cyclic phosphodiesterase [Micrococcales bacterium]MCL2668908.1 RNA 2',3'-cyclic phosphodiesterase [Micrococcales bacterium]
MRLFLAVVPPAQVLDHLDLALAATRHGPAGTHQAVRWSARETWHLTAAFYGEVPDGAAGSLTAGLEGALAELSPYSLALRGAGVFAHRTLWVGVGGDTDAQRRLSELGQGVGDELGLHHDERERNRAHLTIGRARAGTRPAGRRRSRSSGPAELSGVDQIVRALAVYDGPSWTVSSVSLMRSEPGAGRSGGPRYTTVTQWDLEPGTGEP